MCNCCSHGTLLHNSVLQGFAEVIATTTKICACGGSTRALAQIASAHTAASFLLVGRRSARKNLCSPDGRAQPPRSAPSIFRAS